LKHLFITGLIDAPSVDSNRGVSDFATKPFLASLLTGNGFDSVQDLIDTATSQWGLSSKLIDATYASYERVDDALLRKTGQFAKQPFLFAGFDDELLRTTLEDFVPGTLLEGGTMAAIVRRLAFDWETAHRLVDPAGVATALNEIREASIPNRIYEELSASRPLVNDALRDATRLRGGRIYTLDFPAISLRLAILARLAARQHDVARRYWARHQFVLQQISAAFPDLVELDLTIAELFIKMKESSEND
jgi:hypothetical protein